MLHETLEFRTKLPVTEDFPAHSQINVERAVKLLFEASHIVCGQEARHRHILVKTIIATGQGHTLLQRVPTLNHMRQ